MLRMGDVVKQKHDAGYGLNDESNKRHKTDGAPDGGVVGEVIGAVG